MELHPLVRLEWRDDHVLSRRSLIWIDEHADPGDPHPVRTAIEQLRAERVDALAPHDATIARSPSSSKSLPQQSRLVV